MIKQGAWHYFRMRFATYTSVTYPMISSVSVSPVPWYTHRSYAPRQYISLSHSPLLILQQGLVSLSTSTEAGEETILAMLKPGDLLNNLWAEPGDPHEVAYTFTEVRVKMIERQVFESLLRNEPSLAHEVIRATGARVRQLERHLRLLNSSHVQTRLVALLRFIAEQCGNRQENVTVIDNFLTHNDLAAIIGASRQIVSVCINRLERKGCLSYTRRRIILTDRFPL